MGFVFEFASIADQDTPNDGGILEIFRDTNSRAFDDLTIALARNGGKDEGRMSLKFFVADKRLEF